MGRKGSRKEPKIEKKPQPLQMTPKLSKDEMSLQLIENFSTVIKQKREKLQLKQEDLAKQINEKVSIIHKVETGHFEPNMDLARKFEKFLKIKLIEQTTLAAISLGKSAVESYTLGDFISVRK